MLCGTQGIAVTKKNQVQWWIWEKGENMGVSRLQCPITVKLVLSESISFFFFLNEIIILVLKRCLQGLQTRVVQQK